MRGRNRKRGELLKWKESEERSRERKSLREKYIQQPLSSFTSSSPISFISSSWDSLLRLDSCSSLFFYSWCLPSSPDVATLFLHSLILTSSLTTSCRFCVYDKRWMSSKRDHTHLFILCHNIIMHPSLGLCCLSPSLVIPEKMFYFYSPSHS